MDLHFDVWIELGFFRASYKYQNIDRVNQRTVLLKHDNRLPHLFPGDRPSSPHLSKIRTRWKNSYWRAKVSRIWEYAKVVDGYCCNWEWCLGRRKTVFELWDRLEGSFAHNFQRWHLWDVLWTNDFYRILRFIFGHGLHHQKRRTKIHAYK